MPTAILSVSDKTGIVEFASGLAELGWDLVSTGGTARVLREAGVRVSAVGDVTGHPEMLEGRVKTLHPAILAGLLARRDRPDDMEALERLGYGAFDLVAVNLYPFQQAVAAGAGLAEAMEQVDIGGPTMLRAAAKNHVSVIPVVHPGDYARVLDSLRAGGLRVELRVELAQKVFEHTSSYDTAIAAYLGAAHGAAQSAHGQRSPPELDNPGDGGGSTSFPDEWTLELRKVQDLRYGENPDQPAAFYEEPEAALGSLPSLRQLHGQELSFNNLLDLDAAVLTVSVWGGTDDAACAIIKHTTPCGVALGADAAAAFARARAADPTSAFGGIVAFNVPVTEEAALAIAESFFELVVAPEIEPAALDVLTRKKKLRLIELLLEAPTDRPSGFDYKRVRGGLLVQRRIGLDFAEEDWRVATAREPTPKEWADLRFAWRVAAAVKSNAIVLARDGQTLGIGAGQMSRVDSSRIAVLKAGDQEFDLNGAVLASDAFFPFRDGVDAAATAGAAAIVQPGGSVRDEEVIAAANEHGMAMVFTGRRVFRH